MKPHEIMNKVFGERIRFSRPSGMFIRINDSDLTFDVINSYINVAFGSCEAEVPCCIVASKFLLIRLCMKHYHIFKK